jgi:hypothetical protein
MALSERLGRHTGTEGNKGKNKTPNPHHRVGSKVAKLAPAVSQKRSRESAESF